MTSIIAPDLKAPPLPPAEGAGLTERNRVGSKIDVARQLGMTDAQLAEALAALKGLDAALGAALIADALAEVETEKKKLDALVHPPPSPERQELERLRRELQRLREERDEAAANGADANELARRDQEIARLDKALKYAEERITHAEEEARHRAAENLRRRAQALGHGAPPPGQGPANGAGREPAPPEGQQGGGGAAPQPQPQPQPQPGGGTGGGSPSGGGGTGTITLGFDDWSMTVGKEKDPQKHPPAPATLFVRSETSVWAWNRGEQQWDQHTFDGKVLEVQRIESGILVVAEHEAAIYDYVWAEWLPALTTTETLTTG